MRSSNVILYHLLYYRAFLRDRSCEDILKSGVSIDKSIIFVCESQVF